MPRYRVYCNFIVVADSRKDVEEFLTQDGDFVEKHAIVDEAKSYGVLPFNPDPDDIYADISNETEEE